MYNQEKVELIYSIITIIIFIIIFTYLIYNFNETIEEFYVIKQEIFKR